MKLIRVSDGRYMSAAWYLRPNCVLLAWELPARCGPRYYVLACPSIRSGILFKWGDTPGCKNSASLVYRFTANLRTSNGLTAFDLRPSLSSYWCSTRLLRVITRDSLGTSFGHAQNPIAGKNGLRAHLRETTGEIRASCCQVRAICGYLRVAKMYSASHTQGLAFTWL